MLLLRILPLCLLVSAAASRAQSGPDLGDIHLPPGFEIELWAGDVPNARSLALGDAGTVFVSTRQDGRVYAVTETAPGSRSVVAIAEGLRMPNGIAFRNGSLYVAENHRIIRYDVR